MTRAVARDYGSPMLQEYIPGNGKQNLYLTMDREGDLKVVLTPQVKMLALRMFRDSTGRLRGGGSPPPDTSCREAAPGDRMVGWHDDPDQDRCARWHTQAHGDEPEAREHPVGT